jgi:hypothetical protein
VKIYWSCPEAMEMRNGDIIGSGAVREPGAKEKQGEWESERE